jgi:thiol-disulfide isomerase/thioredoxin
MVARSESVVTPERFAAGKTYPEYRASFTQYGDLYDENYAATKVSEEDARYFRELAARPDGPAKVLVITENWCPDCYREAPVMARVAEAAGMELRVVERDQHKDIMAEFKKNGEFESIPVFVFYTKDHRYITHFIERSKYAEAHINDMRVGTEGMTPEQRAAHNAKFRKEHWPTWRQATIDQLKEMLGGGSGR